MCNPASGVFVKEHKAYWSKYSDSHEDIIEEHKLNADGVKGPNIVRFEISPQDGDMRKPFQEWVYKVDQDQLPEWYDREEAEKSARLMLVEWAKEKIVTSDRRVREGNVFVLSGKVKLYDSSSAVLYGNSSSAELCNSSSAELYNSSSAELFDSSSAKLYNHSSVTLHNSSSAVLFNSSSAKLFDSSSAKLFDSSSAALYGNSSSVTLYDSSSTKLFNSSSAALYGNSSSAKLFDSSSATRYTSLVKAEIISPNAVLIDRSVTPPVCYVGDMKGGKHE